MPDMSTVEASLHRVGEAHDHTMGNALQTDMGAVPGEELWLGDSPRSALARSNALEPRKLRG